MPSWAALFGRKARCRAGRVGTGLAASWFGTALWMAVMAALVAFVMALTGFMSRRRALNLGGGWGSGRRWRIRVRWQWWLPELGRWRRLRGGGASGR